MAELKLKQLHRGYVLTDFDGNEVGIKDIDHAIDEIRTILEGKDGHNINDVQSPEDIPIKREKYNSVETRRKIFEKARDSIDLIGKFNGAEIARELEMKNSTVQSHLRKLKDELDILIEKWKMEHGERKLRRDADTNTNKDTGIHADGAIDEILA